MALHLVGDREWLLVTVAVSECPSNSPKHISYVLHSLWSTVPICHYPFVTQCHRITIQSSWCTWSKFLEHLLSPYLSISPKYLPNISERSHHGQCPIPTLWPCAWSQVFNLTRTPGLLKGPPGTAAQVGGLKEILGDVTRTTLWVSFHIQILLILLLSPYLDASWYLIHPFPLPPSPPSPSISLSWCLIHPYPSLSFLFLLFFCLLVGKRALQRL